MPFGSTQLVETLTRFKTWLARRRQPAWEPLASDDSGFSTGTRRVDWAQIDSIAAFKRDLLTFDDVWFQLEVAGERIMVCEAQPGFAAWDLALVAKFPSAAGWRRSIIKPAFAENFTMFYRRSDGTVSQEIPHEKLR